MNFDQVKNYDTIFMSARGRGMVVAHVTRHLVTGLGDPVFFCSYSECPDTEHLERQVLRERLFSISIFYQQSDAVIKSGTAR